MRQGGPPPQQPTSAVGGPSTPARPPLPGGAGAGGPPVRPATPLNPAQMTPQQKAASQAQHQKIIQLINQLKSMPEAGRAETFAKVRKRVSRDGRDATREGRRAD